MKKDIKKFLEFNGKSIHFLAVDGQYWIAIKPIMEALGVEYTRQFKNLKEDKILGPALALQPMQVPGDQVRNYACLPEFYIYGWLFSIQSASEELANYKWQCYRILYEHFHGAIVGRKELLTEKVKAQLERDRCLNTLDPEVAYRLSQADKKRKQVNNELRKLDLQVMEEEKTLFDT